MGMRQQERQVRRITDSQSDTDLDKTSIHWYAFVQLEEFLHLQIKTSECCAVQDHHNNDLFCISKCLVYRHAQKSSSTKSNCSFHLSHLQDNMVIYNGSTALFKATSEAKCSELTTYTTAAFFDHFLPISNEIAASIRLPTCENLWKIPPVPPQHTHK